MRGFGLNSNQLKLLALVAMTCDHVGRMLLPQYPVLMYIGRLAFPIFAYLIAEGCAHTRNRKRYLYSMLSLALGCQVVYWLALDSWYQCVLVSFSLAISLIYLLDWAKNSATAAGWVAFAMAVFTAFFVCWGLPQLLPQTDFSVDYGFWGVLLPLVVYLGKTKPQKLWLAAVPMVTGCLIMGGMQWYSLAALGLLALYNGHRGLWKMKYLFYIYYPAHMGVIYLISLL